MEFKIKDDKTLLNNYLTGWSACLNELSGYIHANNVNKGFWPEDKQSRNVGEALMLAVTELSEAMEAHRSKELQMDKHLPYRKAWEVELTDAMIRILDLAAGFNLDIGGALIDKVEFNKTRPYKHSKNY